MAVSNEDMLAMARELPIPVPWDRDVFIANIAAQRGRPIHLIPTDTAALAGSPCGLWLTREHDDLILHEIGTSEYHIDQIVFFGHFGSVYATPIRSWPPPRAVEVESREYW